jgi:hypothetical protein
MDKPREKVEAAMRLLKKAQDGKGHIMPAIGLILEVYEEAPEVLDPMVRALVPSVLLPLADEIEESLDFKVFSGQPKGA